ncbi:hypothetical protein [Streptomyces sp. H27-D2]|uniref:hypothetical protein n=1 Tax=Streptomyces sp. H27-D2 TaxID=3046304 RepID=UPI002DC01B81|nr:hypothetical protein [Streptomyces sp. H27-D2]MEC4016564.1 hypothetical protein [Streptomyces sp. H27-D2]
MNMQLRASGCDVSAFIAVSFLQAGGADRAGGPVRVPFRGRRLKPYPGPENEAERAANRQAVDDYQRQEEEGADFLDWEKELA